MAIGPASLGGPAQKFGVALDKATKAMATIMRQGFFDVRVGITGSPLWPNSPPEGILFLQKVLGDREMIDALLEIGAKLKNRKEGFDYITRIRGRLIELMVKERGHTDDQAIAAKAHLVNQLHFPDRYIVQRIGYEVAHEMVLHLRDGSRNWSDLLKESLEASGHDVIAVRHCPDIACYEAYLRCPDAAGLQHSVKR